MADFFVNIEKIFCSALGEMWSFLTGNWQGIVALAALFISWKQNENQKLHSKITLKPHLYTFTYTDTHTDENGIKQIYFQVELINSGLGPAHIKRYDVFYEGQIIEGKDKGDAVAAFLEVLLKDFSTIRKQSAVLGKKASLIASERRIILDIRVIAKKEDDLDRLKQLIEKFRLEIDYESYYGEIFTLNSDEE